MCSGAPPAGARRQPTAIRRTHPEPLLSPSNPGALACRLAVVGVDANGQDPPEIIDLAVLPIDPEPAPVRASSLRSWLVRPARPITSAVTRDVHSIRNCDVFACPGWNRVAAEIHDALRGRVLVAHGAAEHHRVLAAHLPGWRPPLVLDTARLARNVWPRLAGGYGLARLVTHAGLVAPPFEPGRRRHRAGYDAWMTGQLLITLARRASLTWEQLVTAARVP
jgi:DNA polymerase III epsilon subunit-like protein